MSPKKKCFFPFQRKAVRKNPPWIPPPCKASSGKLTRRDIYELTRHYRQHRIATPHSPTKTITPKTTTLPPPGAGFYPIENTAAKLENAAREREQLNTALVRVQQEMAVLKENYSKLQTDHKSALTAVKKLNAIVEAQEVQISLLQSTQPTAPTELPSIAEHEASSPSPVDDPNPAGSSTEQQQLPLVERTLRRQVEQQRRLITQLKQKLKKYVQKHTESSAEGEDVESLRMRNENERLRRHLQRLRQKYASLFRDIL